MEYFHSQKKRKWFGGIRVLSVFFFGAGFFVLSIHFAQAGFKVQPVRQVVDDEAIASVTATAASDTAAATTSYTVSIELTEDLASGGQDFLRVDFQQTSGCPQNANYSEDCSYKLQAGAAVTGLPDNLTTDIENSIGSGSFSIIPGGEQDDGLSAGTLTFTLSGMKNPVVGGLGRVAVTANFADEEPCTSYPCPTTYSGATYIGAIAFRGQVTYSGGENDGDPVSNTFVSMNSKDFSVWSGSSVDALGEYVILAPVASGQYFLSADLPQGVTGYLRAQSDAITYSGSTQVVNLELDQALKTISGTVKYKDGTPVTDASVSANSRNGRSWAGTNTDSSGAFSIAIGCGEYDVMISPSYNQETGQPNAVDWMYSNPPKSTSFACTDSLETKTQNFLVDKADASVSGRLVDDQGRVVTNAWVNLHTQEGRGNGGGLDRNGRFSFPIIHGNYKLDIWSQDSSLYYNGAQITIGENEARDLGDVVLSRKTSHIRGIVRDTNGSPVQGLRVNAWVRDGQGWGNTETDSDGRYDMAVFAGTWELNIDTFGNQGYISNGSSRLADVKDNKTVDNINFTVQVADASITLTTVDESGNAVADVFGWTSCWVGQDHRTQYGGNLENGRSTIQLIGGKKYTCGMFLPPESTMLVKNEVEVQVGVGGQAEAQLVLVAPDSNIHVILKDQDGKQLKNVEGEVFAFNPDTNIFRPSRLNPDGTANLPVLSGNYSIGYHLRDARYLNGRPDNENTEVSGNITKVLTTIRANATVRGTLSKPDGNPVPFAWIGASNGFFKEDEAQGDFKGGQVIETGTEVRGDGTFELPIVAGKYHLFVGFPPETGTNLMPPEIQEITIDGGQTKVLDLSLREPDVVITGTIKDEEGNDVKRGFCHAWSTEQGFTGREFSDGTYSLPIMEGTWFVGCDSFGHESGNGKFLRSQEKSITVAKDTTEGEDFVLTEALFQIPEGFSQSVSCTAASEFTLPDGTRLSIPANALCTDGNATVTAEPNTNLFHSLDSKPLMFAWNFEALDGDNQLIESFNSNVTITIPYSQDVVDSEGIDENNLIGKYFDEGTQTWKLPEGVTVDPDHNLVTVQVSHFTDFAVVNTGETDASAKRHDIVVTPAGSGGPQVAVWNESGKMVGTWFVYGKDLRMGIQTKVAALDATGGANIITVPGAGFPAQVRIFDADGKVLNQFFAYDPSFKGGISLSVYDVDGDGDKEIVTIPNAPGGPDLKIFDQGGTLVAQFNAYDPSFRKGALVEAFDLNADGQAEIVTAPKDGSSQVRIFEPNGRVANQFNAYPDSYKKGIASLSLADLDGDGEGEIIVTPNEASSQVRVFHRDGNWVTQFQAYGTAFAGGARVSVGDLDGDGVKEIVALPNKNGSAQARIFNKDGMLKGQFFAYPETTRRGQFSATLADLDADGTSELVFGTGRDLGPHIRIFSGRGELIQQFMALHSLFRGGVNVSALER